MAASGRNPQKTTDNSAVCNCDLREYVFVMLGRIIHTPIALFGCPLGLLGLTLATLHVETLERFPHVAGGLLLTITIAVFTLLLVAYGIKAFRAPASAWSDWSHPVRSNFFAVISGTFVLLGLAILPFSVEVAQPIWVVGASTHLAVTLGIVAKWLGPEVFETTIVSPVLFLPAVGNVLVPLAGVPLGFVEVSWFFFSVGLILWVTLLPIVIGRLLTQASLPDGLLPTLVILIAPPSLLMMGYQKLEPNGIHVFSKLLYYSSLIFFLVVSTQWRRFAQIEFSISWWAYTFPMAAFTVATLTFAETSKIVGFKYLGAGLFVMLIAIVTTVLWKTLRVLFSGKLFVAEP
jgi:tellurite resistance protein